MAEYIDREAVINYLRECEGTPPELGYTYPIYKAMERFVGGLPAADVVPVVRCKECKHMNIVGVGYRWCKVWERIQTMGDDGYCCFGERRSDNA